MTFKPEGKKKKERKFYRQTIELLPQTEVILNTIACKLQISKTNLIRQMIVYALEQYEEVL